MGLSPYIQVEGFIEEGVQLILLALGGPGHHLGELVPGLQGELDEGVTGAWGGAAISPRLLPLVPQHRRLSQAEVTGHTGWQWGSRVP